MRWASRISAGCRREGGRAQHARMSTWGLVIGSKDERGRPMTTGTDPAPLRVLVFGAALRAGSLNARLASQVARLIAESGADVDLASMRDFSMPLYDGDAEYA